MKITTIITDVLLVMGAAAFLALTLFPEVLRIPKVQTDPKVQTVPAVHTGPTVQAVPAVPAAPTTKSETPDYMGAVCWVFALLPGLVALANYAVTLRRHNARHEESKHRPRWPEELAAALLLTTVFLVVARAPKGPDAKPEAWVFAGYGAYISTVWFMVVRLNASALSPRFLINSALKVSIAVFIGYIAAQTDIFTTTESGATIYFAIGLFHAWAMRALKKTAMATFGIAPAWQADISLTSIDGLDDDAADVLQEIGITSAQHLATMRTAEVCGRTFYPRGRVLDWIDQAILAKHTNGRLPELRAIGIHSAHALVAIAGHLKCEEAPGHAKERLDEATKRLGMSDGSALLIVECIEQDPAYIALESARRAEVASARWSRSFAWMQARSPLRRKGGSP